MIHWTTFIIHILNFYTKRIKTYGTSQQWNMCLVFVPEYLIDKVISNIEPENRLLAGTVQFRLVESWWTLHSEHLNAHMCQNSYSKSKLRSDIGYRG